MPRAYGLMPVRVAGGVGVTAVALVSAEVCRQSRATASPTAATAADGASRI